MTKGTYNKGGQRRTMMSGCGWSARGALREVDAKFRLHKRVCETCRNRNVEIPEYDKVAATANGWNGLDAKARPTDLGSANVFINGELHNMPIKGHTMEKRMQSVQEIIQSEFWHDDKQFNCEHCIECFLNGNDNCKNCGFDMNIWNLP